MNDKDKELIDEAVFKLLINTARLYVIDPKPEILKFGLAMFQEGARFTETLGQTLLDIPLTKMNKDDIL